MMVEMMVHGVQGWLILTNYVSLCMVTDDQGLMMANREKAGYSWLSWFIKGSSWVIIVENGD